MTGEEARTLAEQIRRAAPGWGPDPLRASALELAELLEEVPSIIDQAEIFRRALMAMLDVTEDGSFRTVYQEAVGEASFSAQIQTWEAYGLRAIAEAALDLCGDIS